MSQSKYEGIQNELMDFVPVSCFFLSLLSVAEDYNEDYGTRKSVDFIDAYRTARKNGWLGKDFMMYNDVALLEYLTGKKPVKTVYEGNSLTDMNVASNEYTVTKYAKGKMTHFRRRGYDVYLNSNTVKNGNLVAVYKYTF